MKKLLFTAVVALSTLTVSAQTDKKSWLIGGTASFSSTHEGEIHNTVLDISPMVGYFVAKNFAIGTRIAFNLTSDDGNKSVTEVAMPFVRYYFLSLAEDKIKFFGNANAFYGIEDEGLGNALLTGYGANVGANFFINKKIAFETSVGYSSTKNKNETVKDNTLGFNVGLQMFLFKESK
jgi:outer membrane protein